MVDYPNSDNTSDISIPSSPQLKMNEMNLEYEISQIFQNCGSQSPQEADDDDEELGSMNRRLRLRPLRRSPLDNLESSSDEEINPMTLGEETTNTRP